MGFFGKTKTIAPSVETKAADSKNEEAKKKARLLMTEGENKGQELQEKQGQTIRKVFGN